MVNAILREKPVARKLCVAHAAAARCLAVAAVAIVCWASAFGEEDFGLVSETKWILFGKDFKEDLGRERFFRGTAEVGAGLVRATANVWIDDVGEVTIDGVKAGGTVANADWTKFLSKPGRHQIAAKGKNVNGVGGLCVAIELEYGDGRREHIHTSAAWEASADGKSWRPATAACDALGGNWPRYRAMSAFLSADERRALQGLHRARRERVDRLLASLTGPAPKCRVVYDRGRSRFAFGERTLETAYYNLSEGWCDDNSELRRQVAGFRDAGVHLYGLGCRISEVWLPDGSIDFVKLVESMSGALAIDPDAHFMFCFAQVIAPAWWVKAHPDELVGYAGGTVNPKETNDIKNVATASMASEVWRRDFSDFLARAIRHLEGTPFANRIVAYRIDYGIHHEWHCYGMRDRLFPDNGKAMTAAFRRWTGDPKAEVPGAAERSEAPVAGWLRDPVKQARVIAYERCHAAAVRDCVLAVDKAAKEACGGRCLVGNYCGYFFGMGANPAEGWHLENDAILDSPYVDFQASPQVYGPSARNPGNPQYARCLLEGLRRRGKVALLEADNSPVRAGISYCSFSKTKAEDEALYARDFAQSLCWGCGFWSFDFGNGWYGSDFDDYFRRIYPIRSRPADCASVAEVLYVGDYESVMFSAVPGKGQERTNAATTELITTLGHAGVPFDAASMKDLMSGKLKDYRVYVFGNLHYLTREKLAAVKRLRERGAALVFVGKESGLLTPDGVRPETAEKLQAWGRVAEAGKDAAYWKGLFREFGVHVYSEDESAAFYANAGYAALHVGKAGRHRISLPRRMKVTELYPERKDLGTMPVFNFKSKGAETFIFATEPAEESVDTMADTWVATDGLGRKLPTAADAGPVRKDRTVAIFFFLWHSNYYSDPAQQGPFDISKMLEKDPDLLEHPDSPLFGPFGRFHHWGEPLLGYYVGTDKAVYRKHAQWLSDAGVDAIFFDVTNGPIYEENYMTLIEAFAEHEAAGGRAPKIAFMCPMSGVPPGGKNLRATTVKRLWEKLYKPGIHPELWFRWEGKPLILSYPSYCEGDPLLMLDAIGDLVKDEQVRKPARIEGHVLGQSFTIDRPFVKVQASTPTHRSPTFCKAKLTLRKGGPGGAIVGQCVADRIADNDMTTIELGEPAPAGTYILELSEPEGTVSWWSRPTGEHKGAFVDGRPAAGFRHLKVCGPDPEGERMKAFFTFRAPTSGGGYHHVNKGRDGAWMWAESYPQVMHRGPDGRDEMVSVSVALNATATEGPVPMNCGKGVIGRRWHGGASDPDPAALAKGPCFQEQWNRAHELDPRLVFVTGWNEWIMTRIRKWHIWEIPAGNFVDQYNPEFSRDAEPVRGYWGDAYYWQLAANVRRYKGVRAVPPVVSAPIAVDGRFGDWEAVSPEFRDNACDPMERDHVGWGKAGPYVDRSGRNDIVVAKTSRNGDDLAFYVRTREALTAPADDWMRLFIDADRDASTGWLGYDFLVERVDGKTVLRSHHGRAARSAPPISTDFAWSDPLAEAKCAIGAREMELSLPLKAFGGRLAADGFDFKWADNCIQLRDWTDFTLHGDAAPNDRFNYRAILGDSF